MCNDDDDDDDGDDDGDDDDPLQISLDNMLTRTSQRFFLQKATVKMQMRSNVS